MEAFISHVVAAYLFSNISVIFFFLTFYSSPGSTHALWWATVGQLSGPLFSPSGCCCTCKPAHFSPATRCTRGRRTVIEGEGGIQRKKKKNARCLVGGRIHRHVQRQVLSSAAELKKLRIRCTRAEAALLAAGLKLIRYEIMRRGWRFVLDLQMRRRRLWSSSYICIFDTDDSDWIIIVGLYLLFLPLVAMRERLHMHLWALHCLLSPSPPLLPWCSACIRCVTRQKSHVVSQRHSISAASAHFYLESDELHGYIGRGGGASFVFFPWPAQWLCQIRGEKLHRRADWMPSGVFTDHSYFLFIWCI